MQFINDDGPRTMQVLGRMDDLRDICSFVQFMNDPFQMAQTPQLGALIRGEQL